MAVDRNLPTTIREHLPPSAQPPVYQRDQRLRTQYAGSRSPPRVMPQPSGS